jgi:hypothetical protein
VAFVVVSSPSESASPASRTRLRLRLAGLSPRARLAVAVGGVLAALLVLGADRVGGRGGLPEFEAVPDVLRAAAASVVLFAACGYAPVRLLCPPQLQPHRALLVLPTGAAVAGLALGLLGLLRLPLPASLAVVLLSGAAAGFVVRRREDRQAAPAADPRAGDRRMRILWPALIALTVALLVASPLVRNDSFATVLGENGDAHLATGAAELLQHAPAGAERTELPIDRMPGVWRSKYPIYYVLAGVSTLSGLDPVQTFGTLIAVMAGLSVVGFFLLAFHVLGAGPGASLLALGLVALDRIVFRLAFDPFYNQLWALFSFPLVLLLGWLYLQRPDRRTLVLLGAFAAIAVLAYPLLAPFPALFLGLTAWLVWRRRRAAGERPGWISALRLPRGRRSLLLWVPVGVLLLPLLLALFGAALEKMVDAAEVTLPGGDLGPWSGDTPGFRSLAYFLGLPEGLWLAAAALLALAAAQLRPQPRGVAVPLGAMLVALLAGAAWFDLRGGGALFHFRALSFFAPTALTLVGVGLAGLIAARAGAARWGAVAATVVLASLMLLQVRDALTTAFPHVTHEVWELRTWSERLPPGSSVRVDVRPVGVQQWAWYMLADHPVTATRPPRYFYPHAPVGRKADYLLVNRSRGRPADADGAPRLSNARFALYRIKASVPGPDRSSRKQVIPPASSGGD